MSTKYKNSKRKMASLGLKKNENGDYTYIDENDKTSKFVVVKRSQDKEKWYPQLAKLKKFHMKIGYLLSALTKGILDFSWGFSVNI